MTKGLRLMGVMAHPDDESLGVGGTLARYADEGVATYLVTATRGQRGWFDDPDDYPGLTELGRIREAELRAAAAVLGIREVELLDYVDGELDRADSQEVIARIARSIRRVRPHVILTFDPNGVYGHPDHIAISQFTTAAVLSAAHENGAEPPHAVSKLYYMAVTGDELAAYENAFGELVMHIDGAERRAAGWQDWAVTTRIHTAPYWQQVWEAISCHRTQLPNYEALSQLPDEHHRNLWHTQTFYRALSLVNGGRGIEDDLFAGLR